MITHLPEDLTRYVTDVVRSGRFTSSDEAIAEAVRLLQRREEAENARMLEGVRRALDDVDAGRTQPVAEAFDDLRRELRPPGGS